MKWFQRHACLALAVLLAMAVAGCGTAPSDPAPDQAEAADSPASAEAVEEEADDEVILLSDFDATVYTAQGEGKTLTEIADGKPLVINYWTTWCTYCVQELPDYLDIYRDYHGKVSFAFVDSTDDQDETVENVSRWLADNGYSELPAYYDLDQDACATMGVSALPTTVLVAGDGTIVAAATGAVDPTALREALDSIA